MSKDYIVDQVPRVREEQAAKHDFDVKAMLDSARKRQRRSTRKVVSLVQKKIAKPPRDLPSLPGKVIRTLRRVDIYEER